MEDTSRENAREKLAQAFQDNRERLLRLAERHLNPVLRRRVSPEDVVQEAAAEACRWGGSFLENEDLPIYFRLRAVLLQTITHLERRHLQSAKRDAYREVEPQPSADDDASQGFGADHFPDTATSPLSRITRQDRHAILHQGLMRLDDSDRAILELRHEEGLGNGECAALLGISEKAASLRYVRALKRLKDVLGEYSEFQP